MKILDIKHNGDITLIVLISTCAAQLFVNSDSDIIHIL